MSVFLKNLRFAYPGAHEKQLLNIDQWSVQAGERVFLQGESGSGKSTLLNILSGILTGNTGVVSVLGQRLDHMSGRQRDRFRANHIGYVFQQFNLVPYLSALDNIRLANRFASAGTGKVHGEAPSLSGMQTLLSGLQLAQPEWHKPTAQLSMGQQQRVAIARALVNQPELLIADEPTSSLDQGNRDNFMSVLLDYVDRRDITLIFVSHDRALAHYFSRVDRLTDINGAECTE